MLRDWPRPLDLRQQFRLLRPSWPSGKSGDPPRHGDVDDRAEEEEQDELEQASLHGGGPSRLTSIPNDVSVARTTMFHYNYLPDVLIRVSVRHDNVIYARLCRGRAALVS